MATMEWYNIASILLGGVGGAGGLISLYTARAKKSTIEIENFKRLFDEAQEERENMKKLYSEYEEKTNAKIKELEERLDGAIKTNQMMTRATNSAYRCKFPKDMTDCPVIKLINDECPKKDINGCQI